MLFILLVSPLVSCKQSNVFLIPLLNDVINLYYILQSFITVN